MATSVFLLLLILQYLIPKTISQSRVLVDESIWNCNFDSASWCSFYDAGATQGWTLLSGSTPTTSTGPTSDFSGSGYYLYTESNVNAAPTGGFRLQLDFGYNFTGTAIEFAYSMYGYQIGQFKLLTTVDGRNWDTIWSKEGNVGTSWFRASVDIVNNPISIQFVSQNHSNPFCPPPPAHTPNCQFCI
jgi:hypothetical protein